MLILLLGEKISTITLLGRNHHWEVFLVLLPVKCQMKVVGKSPNLREGNGAVLSWAFSPPEYLSPFKTE